MARARASRALEGLLGAGLLGERVGKVLLLGALDSKFNKADVDRLDNAIRDARRRGLTWLDILGAVLPLLIAIISGEKLTIQDIIDAILELLS